MNQDQLIERMAALYQSSLATARRKNNDYAGEGDAFRNFRGCERHGVSVGQGILVRMEDKMARLGNLLRKSASVTDESFLDTALDLVTYAAILSTWWESERSVKETLPTGGAVIYPFGLLGGCSGPIDRVPGDGDSGKSETKPTDRPDFHGDLGC